MQRYHGRRRRLWAGVGATLILPALAGAGDGQGNHEALLRGEAGGVVPAFERGERRDERVAMVDQQIAGRGTAAFEQAGDSGTAGERVLQAMRRVPRHRFVPEQRRANAYADTPLPIGHGQTISQPYIVARMTELLGGEGDDRVLEVGTGSGYHAAVVAQLVEHLVTIEIIRPLAERAAGRLDRQGYGNVTVIHGDGYYGYPEAAPFDAIVVTAAADHVPPPLTDQLERGGRMVIPVERSGWTQNLLLVRKTGDGSVRTRSLMPVRFVPLTGDH
jgi:protein-L-isoaspartate(D-aspartate) O-methyltransferase